MILENIKKQIISIWDDYVSANKTTLDTKGNVINNIDDSRIKAIGEIKTIINNFLKGNININEFKTSLDSYNKRNNLWGFTATKGQMFFNQLTKTNEQNLDKLTSLLKETITEPKDIKEALRKIELLEKLTTNIFSKAKDKRTAPNPGSVGYFLSYFWQIYNNEKWPIIYSSIIVSLTDIGLWKKHNFQSEAYETFYNLNEEIKLILKKHTGNPITNWDAEHSFWNFRNISTTNHKIDKLKGEVKVTKEDIKTINNASFNISDYIIPKVAKLIELGNESKKSAAAKGSEFEKLVAEIFRQIDFDVDFHGQGSGRNPDAIIKYRKENIAFIIDAKAYSDGYTLGIDDRAIREYINHYYPILQNNGYKKIGFIIVSNSFKSDFDSFINDITWNTDIKRFILLESEALLYLLAYKTKDKLNLDLIIERMVSLGTIVTAQDVIDEFDDK